MTTEHEFLHEQIAVWGEDYINDLIECGYAPILTTDGFKWMKMTPEQFMARDTQSLVNTAA